MAKSLTLSRDALLRAALLVTLSAFYASPAAFLQSEAPPRVSEIRLWLVLGATLVALSGIISTPLLIVSCVHAALHVAQAALHIPVWTPGASLSQWRKHSLPTCVYEYGCIVTFALLLRYLLLPPPSLLSANRKHSRQLQRFFKQHDRKYVSLVDRLLDDYTGNERLLFARIRKIYRTKTLSPSH